MFVPGSKHYIFALSNLKIEREIFCPPCFALLLLTRATELIKELEHLSNGKRLGKLGLLSLEMTRVGTSSMPVSVQREGARRMDPGSWCWAVRQEAKSRRKLMHRSSTRTWGRGFLSSGTDCSERLWCFLWLGIFQNSGHNPVLCAVGWPCLSWKVGPSDPLWSLPNWFVLWFCTSVIIHHTSVAYFVQVGFFGSNLDFLMTVHYHINLLPVAN